MTTNYAPKAIVAQAAALRAARMKASSTLSTKNDTAPVAVKKRDLENIWDADTVNGEADEEDDDEESDSASETNSSDEEREKHSVCCSVSYILTYP